MIKKVWYSYLFFQGIHCLHCANFDAFIYWILNCSPYLCQGSKLQFWISQFDWEPFNSTNYNYKFKWKFTRWDAQRHSIYIRTVRSLLTQPVQALFLFKSIWTRSQGSQGCQKIHKNMLLIKVLSCCARIAPKRHKLRKIIKIEKKCQKNPVFLEYFKYSSIWGQY